MIVMHIIIGIICLIVATKTLMDILMNTGETGVFVFFSICAIITSIISGKESFKETLKETFLSKEFKESATNAIITVAIEYPILCICYWVLHTYTWLLYAKAI